MSDSREYNKLLNEYNRLKANIESLSEELEQKENQWGKKEAYFKNLKAHAKELCETILAKDKSETTLGADYSWSKIDIIELIERAVLSYEKYNKERTDIMKKIIDTAEERASLIEALQEEISYLKQHQSVGTMSKEDIEKLAEKEKAEQNKNANVEHPRNGQAEFFEEDDDYSEDEMQLLAKSMRDNENMQKSSHGNSYYPSAKKIKEKQRLEKEIVSNTETIKEIMDKLSDIGFEIIKIMGQTGVSEKPLIFEKVSNNENIKSSSSTFNMAISSLFQFNLITVENLNLPLRPKLSIINLTSIGSKVFKAKYGGTAVMSEKDKIQAEHDNIEHGYGIKDIYTILLEKSIYTDVSMYNRPGVAINNNLQYVADITCKYKNNPIYIEYERGTHTQKDFDAKLDKMILVTKEVNIVAPNKTVARDTLLPKVQKYISSRNSHKLQNVVIRIAAMRNFKEKDMRDNDDWDFYCDLNKGTKFIDVASSSFIE